MQRKIKVFFKAPKTSFIMYFYEWLFLQRTLHWYCITKYWWVSSASCPLFLTSPSIRYYRRWKDLSLFFSLGQWVIIILTSQKECAYSSALRTRDNEIFLGLCQGSDFKINFNEENKRYISLDTSLMTSRRQMLSTEPNIHRKQSTWGRGVSVV